MAEESGLTVLVVDDEQDAVEFVKAALQEVGYTVCSASDGDQGLQKARQEQPDLVILDAIQILLTNGPKGPGRTEKKDIVVAGTDQLAVDAYGARLLGRTPTSIAHLKRAHEMGVGEIDLARVKVKHV